VIAAYLGTTDETGPADGVAPQTPGGSYGLQDAAGREAGRDDETFGRTFTGPDNPNGGTP
jgi:hypothetical protein